MSAKRGRGRPRKSGEKSALEESSGFEHDVGSSILTHLDGGDVAASAIDRSRRSTRKQTTDNDYIEISNNNDDDDDDDDSYNEQDYSLQSDYEIGQEHKRDKKKTKRAKTTTSKSYQKGRKIRTLRELTSIKDKIGRLYGEDQQKLLNLAKVKESANLKVFDIPEQNLDKNDPFFLSIPPPSSKYDISTHMSDMGYRTVYGDVTSTDAKLLFLTKESATTILINNAETVLQSKEKVEFPVLPNGQRRGFVYNVGGLVTDMAWLYDSNDNEEQYLALSVSQYMDDPLDERLRTFPKGEHISSLQIYKYNATTLDFTHTQTILHKFGETWNLKWHEGVSQNSSTLGVLSFVCQEGSVKFLEIRYMEDSGSTNTFFLEQPLVSISHPEVHITCFDYLSAQSIICGTRDGKVLQFDIAEPNAPSFCYQVHETYITSISSAYSFNENTIVGSVSVDGYIYVYDPIDIYTTKTTITRIRGTTAPLEYSPQLYAFVHSNGSNSLKAVVPRCSFSTHPIASFNTSIFCLALSRIHSSSLSGLSDGSVIIDNIARRLLNSVKTNFQSFKSLRLWKWDYSITEKKYRLNHNYHVIPGSATDTTKIQVDAPGLNITAVKWNESTIAGKTYAFANAAGLLVLEDMRDYAA